VLIDQSSLAGSQSSLFIDKVIRNHNHPQITELCSHAELVCARGVYPHRQREAFSQLCDAKDSKVIEATTKTSSDRRVRNTRKTLIYDQF
jgi:hypothetical protein